MVSGEKIPDRIVGDSRVEAWIENEAVGDGEHCVAIRGRARGHAHADIATGPGVVLRVELLAEAC
jgi:hypothetical protein